MTSHDDIDTIAAALLAHHREHASCPVITMNDAGEFLDAALSLIFPQRANPRLDTEPAVHAALTTLGVALDRLLLKICACDMDRGRIVPAFLASLPKIATAALSDAKAAVAGDPAAHDDDEVILAYPGTYAIAAYRLAHELYLLDVRLLPRLITEVAHQRTGIDIHPGATIGPRFFIDHGTSVVIGETATIGADVKLYQGVTLGALSVDKSMQETKRHPTIEDGVVIYANATILGGRTVIGAGAVIGGNVWLTRSVPPGARVLYQPTDGFGAIEGVAK